MRRRRPAPQVVVVTGASSGIGRGTAHAFARRGACVVLVARGREALEQVADECRTRGGHPVVEVADVSDESQVQSVVRRVVERFGRVDVWVGAAGSWSHGRFEDTPSRVFRQVVDTTLMGQVHGVRAVLPVMRAQGSGVIVLVASLYGRLSAPHVSAYVAAKWGLVGFAEVLRQELRDAPTIDVCTVLPGGVDTPIYRNAAVYLGREIRALPASVPVRRVVQAIVRCVDSPRPTVVVGAVHRTGLWVHTAAPRLYDRAFGPAVARLSTMRSVPATARTGAVLAPAPPTPRVDGGWRRRERRRAAAVVAAAAAGAATAGMVRAARR